MTLNIVFHFNSWSESPGFKITNTHAWPISGLNTGVKCDENWCGHWFILWFVWILESNVMGICVDIDSCFDLCEYWSQMWWELVWTLIHTLVVISSRVERTYPPISVCYSRIYYPEIRLYILLCSFLFQDLIPKHTDENWCRQPLTLTVLNFWKFSSYCSLKPLWSGMGEVVPARTSPTLHPPSPPTEHQLSRLALRVKIKEIDHLTFCTMNIIIIRKCNFSYQKLFVWNSVVYNALLLLVSGLNCETNWRELVRATSKSRNWITLPSSDGNERYQQRLPCHLSWCAYLQWQDSGHHRDYQGFNSQGRKLHFVYFGAIHCAWCDLHVNGMNLKHGYSTVGGDGDVGSVGYEPALLPPCPTIRVLSYSNCQRSTPLYFRNLVLKTEFFFILSSESPYSSFYNKWANLSIYKLTYPGLESKPNFSWYFWLKSDYTLQVRPDWVGTHDLWIMNSTFHATEIVHFRDFWD